MPTARVSEKARRMLRELARETGRTMQEVLEEAIEAYRRRVFLERCNAAYAALRSDPQAWEEEMQERREWEGTLADDLEGD